MFKNVSRHDQILVKIAFSNRLITKSQLTKALSIQQELASEGKELSIDKIFLKCKILGPDLVQDLLIATKRSFGKGFGARAIKKGFVTPKQVDKALNIQAREFSRQHTCRFIGEILMDEGAITAAQRQIILEEMNLAVSKKQTVADAEKGDEKASSPTDSAEKESVDKTDGAVDRSLEVRLDGITIQLVVSKDRLEARLIITVDHPAEIPPDTVENLLEDGNIDFEQVDEDQLAAFLSDLQKGRNEWVAARGKPPFHGVDASIRYHFEAEYLEAGQIGEDGAIDYKERGKIPIVKEGVLLAEKTPVQEARPGLDVYGEALPAHEPEDREFSCGGGVRISEDGLKVYAAVEGQPNLTVTGKISVFDEFHVQGDVDYKTGNIDFDGNILVDGTVRDGFRVVGGNLAAQEIDQAKIHLKGNLQVKGGIFGARIQTEGQVQAKYVKDANIKSYEDVIIDKEILDSKIRTSGKCIVERGKIISSLVTAKGGIIVKEIGTDVSSPCTIKVGMEEHIRKIIQGFDYAIIERKTGMEKKQSRYEQLREKQNRQHVRLTELTQMQERARTLEEELQEKEKDIRETDSPEALSRIETVLKESRQKYQAVEAEVQEIFDLQDQLITDIDVLQKEIEADVAAIEQAVREKEEVHKWARKGEANPVVVVKGSIFGGTRIITPNAKTTIEETQKNVTIKEINTEDNENIHKIYIVKGSGASAFKKA